MLNQNIDVHIGGFEKDFCNSGAFVMAFVIQHFGLLLNHKYEMIYTVKTNILKKRVAVVMWKIIFFVISLFSKLVIYILIPVVISRRTVSRTQDIDIILVLLYNLRCYNVSACWKKISRYVLLINTIMETLFQRVEMFSLPKRCLELKL